MAIDNEDIARLKEIFVTRRECDEQMDDVNKKLANDSKELAIINTKLSLVLWLLAAVGASIIAMLIQTFWG